MTDDRKEPGKRPASGFSRPASRKNRGPRRRQKPAAKAGAPPTTTPKPSEAPDPESESEIPIHKKRPTTQPRRFDIENAHRNLAPSPWDNSLEFAIPEEARSKPALTAPTPPPVEVPPAKERPRRERSKELPAPSERNTAIRYDGNLDAPKSARTTVKRETRPEDDAPARAPLVRQARDPQSTPTKPAREAPATPNSEALPDVPELSARPDPPAPRSQPTPRSQPNLPRSQPTPRSQPNLQPPRSRPDMDPPAPGPWDPPAPRDAAPGDDPEISDAYDVLGYEPPPPGSSSRPRGDAWRDDRLRTPHPRSGGSAPPKATPNPEAHPRTPQSGPGPQDKPPRQTSGARPRRRPHTGPVAMGPPSDARSEDPTRRSGERRQRDSAERERRSSGERERRSTGEQERRSSGERERRSSGERERRASSERERRPGAESWRRSPHAIAKPATFLRGMAILSLLLLFEAWAVPALGDGMRLVPPWTLMGDSGSLTFAAGVAFGAILVITALPMPYLLRCLLLAGGGIAMLVLALIHARAVVAGFGFRGHPGIALGLAGPAGLTALIAATLVFPTALYWRSRYTASLAARIAVLVGMLVVISAYMLGGAAGAGGGPPLLTLISKVTGATLLADKLAAAVLLIPAIVVPLASLVLLRHPHTGFSSLWAWLHVTALGGAVLIQAGFVSGWRAGEWKAVLAPLESALFLYAALLLAPVALGHLIGEAERLIRLSSLKRREAAA